MLSEKNCNLKRPMLHYVPICNTACGTGRKTIMPIPISWKFQIV